MGSEFHIVRSTGQVPWYRLFTVLLGFEIGSLLTEIFVLNNPLDSSSLLPASIDSISRLRESSLVRY